MNVFHSSRQPPLAPGMVQHGVSGAKSSRAGSQMITAAPATSGLQIPTMSTGSKASDMPTNANARAFDEKALWHQFARPFQHAEAALRVCSAHRHEIGCKLVRLVGDHAWSGWFITCLPGGQHMHRVVFGGTVAAPSLAARTAVMLRRCRCETDLKGCSRSAGRACREQSGSADDSVRVECSMHVGN